MRREGKSHRGRVKYATQIGVLASLSHSVLNEESIMARIPATRVHRRN